MGNPNLLPYETIVRATKGEPEAVDEVLRHYSKRIRIAAIENGHIDRDTEDSIKSRLVAALFKFHFDEQPYTIPISQKLQNHIHKDGRNTHFLAYQCGITYFSV